MPVSIKSLHSSSAAYLEVVVVVCVHDPIGIELVEEPARPCMLHRPSSTGLELEAKACLETKK